MDHFSDCVLTGKDPLTPGEEGLADMRVIAAIEEAARTGQAVRLRFLKAASTHAATAKLVAFQSGNGRRTPSCNGVGLTGA